MDVTDYSPLLKLEETLKDYITRMEVNTDPDIRLSSFRIIARGAQGKAGLAMEWEHIACKISE